MLKRSFRRKPISVMPKRSAVLTARLEGAPTAARTGIPAMTGLLHQFETGAAADHQNVVREREAVVKVGAADQLVDGVVAAHVFTDQHEVARGGEKPARVQAASTIEDLLRLRGVWLAARDDGFRDPRHITRKNGATCRLDGLDGGFSADSATRC